MAVTETSWFAVFVWIVSAAAIVACIYAIEKDNCERSGGHLRWLMNNSVMCLYPDGRVVE